MTPGTRSPPSHHSFITARPARVRPLSAHGFRSVAHRTLVCCFGFIAKRQCSVGFAVFAMSAAVGGCEYGDKEDPGNLELDWLEVQLERYRERNMQVRFCSHFTFKDSCSLKNLLLCHSYLIAQYDRTNSNSQNAKSALTFDNFASGCQTLRIWVRY